MNNNTAFSWGRPYASMSETRYMPTGDYQTPVISRFEYGEPPDVGAKSSRITSLSVSEIRVARVSNRRRGGRLATKLLAAFAITACGVAGATPAERDGATTTVEGPPAMGVEVAVSRLTSIASEVAVVGRIEAIQAIELRPEVEGRIVAILVNEGQIVASGAPLFRIDDAELNAHVARATAERNLAKQALTRTRELLAENASSRADLERAEAQEQSAQAQLDLLSLRLARTTVRAPFSGVVGRRMVSLGDFVSAQVPLATLQTTNPQRITLDVPERFAASLKKGQRVEFAIAAYPGRRFVGSVDFVDPVVALPGRSITVKANATNSDGALQAGMFVEARVATATRADAVLVPEQALMPAPGGKYAAWVVVDGVARFREVLIGIRRAGEVEITNGVAAGEQVVIGGLLQLMDGTPVNATVVTGVTPNTDK